MKLLPHFVWNYINNSILSTKKFIYLLKINHIQKNTSRSQKKVLVLAHSGGVGNAIEATPLVQAIRMLWPSCHLTFAPPAGDLFENWCIPDQIVENAQEVKGKRFDHTFAAYLYEDLSNWKDNCDLGEIHTLKIWQKKWFLKPERDYYTGMLKRFGFKGVSPPCFVTIKKPEIMPPESDFRICIAPCGKNEGMWKHKKWPYYPELIHALRDQYPSSQICIIGTREDDIDVEFDGQNILDFRSAYSLSETAWLLKQSDFVVGNDCGPMHIADAVGAGGIVIFGPTCTVKNGPRNKLIPIVSNIKCQPCQYSEIIKECKHANCIMAITPEKMLSRLKMMINQK